MEFQLVRAAEVATEALDVGPDSKLNLVDVFDRTQGAPFCAGVCEVFPGGPVDFDYDDDAAACYMIKGEIKLTENGILARSFPATSSTSPRRRGWWSTGARDLRQVLLRDVPALAVAGGRGGTRT